MRGFLWLINPQFVLLLACNYRQIIMYKIISKLGLLLVLSVLATSCGDDQTTETDSRVAKGGVVSYGGTFNMNEEKDYRSLYPHSINEVVGHRICNQVFEGLIALDQEDLSITKRLAENYSVENQATLFRFNIRKGVKFHDDPCFEGGKGRELTAHDFKYCFDRLCGSYADNAGYAFFRGRVKGAEAYYNSTIEGKPLKTGVEGVRVIDDYTLEIELDYSFAGFVNILASSFCWVFPHEAVEKYGSEVRVHPVGTGAFYASKIKEGDVVYLTHNKNYWRVDTAGNQLPYLDAIKVSFIKDKKSEFLEFKKKNLDFIFEIPDELIGEILEPQVKNEFVLDVEKALSVQYYGFQNAHGVFSDKRVRQAFIQAVDRDKIVMFTLQGNGFSAKHGFVPPAFEGYDAKSITGYEFNPDEARKLLAEAGYPNGEGFPELSLQLNSTGASGRNKMIAEVVKNQIKENLGVEIKLEIVPWAQHLENVESGKSMFWRTGWLADYPDPENFLNLFYGAHVPENQDEPAFFNNFRYKNPAFDEVFEKALKEVDESARMKYYQEADRIVTEDAVVLPLYYEENYRLKRPWVKNFHSNAMEYRDLSMVYFSQK